MADNQIRLPSGSGGITRYFDEATSKIEYSPTVAVAIVVIVLFALILLHIFGRGLLG